MRRTLVRVLIVAILLVGFAVRPAGAFIQANITATSTNCAVVGSCVTLSLSPEVATVSLQLTGTWTATLVWEATVDGGVSWFSIQSAVLSSPAGALVTSATANGQWTLSTAGLDAVRVRASAFTSGTAVVTLETSLSTQTLGAGNVVSLVSIGGGTTDVLRTCAVFKQANATVAGNTVLWTPAGGKKFRLMRFSIGVSGANTLAVAGNEVITFQDAAVAMPFRADVQIPGAAVTGEDFISPWIDLGNGFLSATANNALNINLGTAIAAGPGVTITTCGTEE